MEERIRILEAEIESLKKEKEELLKLVKIVDAS